MRKIKLNKNVTVEQLLEYGFTFHYPYTYQYRIPAYKYKRKLPLLFLEFTINFERDEKNNISANYIDIDCKNRDGTFYKPFYTNDYCNENDVLKKVQRIKKSTISDLHKNNISITNVRRKKKHL